MALALVVTHEVTPGHEDAFDSLTARALEGIRSMEPGTLAYVVHSSAEHPQRRVFYELYADRSAFAAHERFPHMRTFLAERPAHVDSVSVQFLDVDGAHLRPA